MNNTKKQYCYSRNDKVYYDSLEEMIDMEFDYLLEQREDVDQVTIYRGERENYTHFNFINAYSLIDSARERVYDFAAESIADNYLESFTDEHAKELEKLVSDWLTKKFGKVDFWGVKNVKQIPLDDSYLS